MTLHFSDIEAQVDRIASNPAHELSNVSTSSKAYRDVFKRAFDCVLVVATAPISVPLVLIFAIYIWLRTGASPFYLQKRIGQGGRVFTMVKLRTMQRDADERLETYLMENPDARSEWESTQKLKNDPRIIAGGHFLRKSSIDEVPQLWNVLTGDMSLVGPRPMMVCQQSLYPGRDYYEMRPGLTGFWQISDRNDCSFATRASHDASYNQSLSLKTDMMVIAATVAVVLRGTGY